MHKARLLAFLISVMVPAVSLGGTVTSVNDGADGWASGDDWDAANIIEHISEIDDNAADIVTNAGALTTHEGLPNAHHTPTVDTTLNVIEGTSALGTSVIAANSCASLVTTTATGTLTTDPIIWTPNADIEGVAGYGVGASGDGLVIYSYPTANNVNFKVCNATSSSITPGAVTLNWRVIQ